MPRIVVTLGPLATYTVYHAECEPQEDGSLLIADDVRNRDLKRLGVDEWLWATAYDEDGWPIYSHTNTKRLIDAA